MITINDKQMSEMLHALGINKYKVTHSHKVREINKRIKDINDDITRNYFYTFANDENWNDLVNKGLAIKHKGWEEDKAYFKVTTLGKNFIKSCLSGGNS